MKKNEGYVSIPQIKEKARKNESEWHTWTNYRHVNSIQYPSSDFEHKYMEWMSIITNTIFNYEKEDGLIIKKKKDFILMVSSEEENIL